MDGTEVGVSERTTLELSAVTEFVANEIAPIADRYDLDEKIPQHLLDRFSQLGLWAPFLPPEVGGLGADMVSVGQLHEAIGAGCSSLRSLLTVHSMVSWSVMRWGSEQQKQHWLPKLASGQTLGAFCLTEPESGSDADARNTIAAQAGDSDGWILNGRKKWITGGQIANLLLVFGRTESGMSSFLIPSDSPGVEVIPMSGVLGTRASMLAEIVFRDVRVPPEALLGPVGWAAGTVMTSALDLGRYSVACGSVGIIQASLDACASYTEQRRVKDGLLRDLPLIRRKISDMVTSVRAARSLCLEAGRLKDAEDPKTIMATWVAKYFASTAAATAASDAVQIHGANGFSQDYPVARFYRDAKVMEVIEGSSELQQSTIADEAYREVARAHPVPRPRNDQPAI